MAALLTISLSACSQSNKKENKEMKKVLVAYFSASGVTEGVAKQLAEVKRLVKTWMQPILM